jgi:hypothetical protein
MASLDIFDNVADGAVKENGIPLLFITLLINMLKALDGEIPIAAQILSNCCFVVASIRVDTWIDTKSPHFVIICCHFIIRGWCCQMVIRELCGIAN